MVKHNQNLLVSESSEQNEKNNILNLLNIEKRQFGYGIYSIAGSDATDQE